MDEVYSKKEVIGGIEGKNNTVFYNISEDIANRSTKDFYKDLKNIVEKIDKEITEYKDEYESNANISEKHAKQRYFQDFRINYNGDNNEFLEVLDKVENDIKKSRINSNKFDEYLNAVNKTIFPIGDFFNYKKIKKLDSSVTSAANNLACLGKTIGYGLASALPTISASNCSVDITTLAAGWSLIALGVGTIWSLPNNLLLAREEVEQFKEKMEDEKIISQYFEEEEILDKFVENDSKINISKGVCTYYKNASDGMKDMKCSALKFLEE